MVSMELVCKRHTIDIDLLSWAIKIGSFLSHPGVSKNRASSVSLSYYLATKICLVWRHTMAYGPIFGESLTHWHPGPGSHHRADSARCDSSAHVRDHGWGKRSHSQGAESAERGWGGEDDERCDPALIFFTLQGISEWHSEGKLPHWAGAWTDRNGDFTWFTAPVQEKWPVPSGKHTKKYGNSPFLIGKPSISTDHFPWLCSS